VLACYNEEQILRDSFVEIRRRSRSWTAVRDLLVTT